MKSFLETNNNAINLQKGNLNLPNRALSYQSRLNKISFVPEDPNPIDPSEYIGDGIKYFGSKDEWFFVPFSSVHFTVTLYIAKKVGASDYSLTFKSITATGVGVGQNAFTFGGLPTFSTTATTLSFSSGSGAVYFNYLGQDITRSVYVDATGSLPTNGVSGRVGVLTVSIRAY